MNPTKQASRIEGVDITIEKAPRCHWHSNCKGGDSDRHGSGIMKIVRHEPDRTIFECLSCGQYGYVPAGHPFGVVFCSPLMSPLMALTGCALAEGGQQE